MAFKSESCSNMLIDGEWTTSASGATLPVENPAKRTIIGHVPRAEAADVDRAVKAARVAFEEWRRVPPSDRGRALLRIGELIKERSELIATTIAKETGNAIRTQSRPEAQEASEIFRYFGGVSRELKGEILPLGSQTLSYNQREPLGVVGAIVPWNTPVELAALKIAPAICAGNGIVLKAAEDAPLSVLLLAEICNEVLPKGIVNVLTGTGEECGAAISHHDGIDMLSFTGSTEVGRQIMAAAAKRIVPVALELGGKSPSIVFPDIDVESTVQGVISAMRFTRQSQSCTAGSRLLLHASIFDQFLSRLTQKLSELVIGDPLDEKTDIGTLINKRQFEKVCTFIQEGLNNPGVQLVTGGLPPKDGPLSEGYYTRPTVFVTTSNSARLMQEEIFGPVLTVVRWTEEAEVIRIANDSHFGLAAFIWTRDITKAIQTANAVEAGWIQVNQGLGQVLGQSYGGYKQSGIGRECSLEGMLDSYTQRKNITIRI